MILLLLLSLGVIQSARATVVLSLSNPTCTITNSSSSGTNPTCTQGVDPLSVGSNGLQGASFYLGDPGNTVTDNLKATGTPVGVLLTMSTSGVAGGSGSIANGTTIPFTYAFTVSVSGTQIDLNSYMVEFNITTTAGINGAGSVFGGPVMSSLTSLGGVTTATPTGSLSAILTSPINAGTTYFTTAQLMLLIDDTNSGNRGLSLTLSPDLEFDVNAVAPEPATMALSATALAGLLAWARRRRKSSWRLAAQRFASGDRIRKRISSTL